MASIVTVENVVSGRVLVGSMEVLDGFWMSLACSNGTSTGQLTIPSALTQSTVSCHVSVNITAHLSDGVTHECRIGGCKSHDRVGEDEVSEDQQHGCRSLDAASHDCAALNDC